MRGTRAFHIDPSCRDAELNLGSNAALAANVETPAHLTRPLPHPLQPPVPISTVTNKRFVQADAVIPDDY